MKELDAEIIARLIQHMGKEHAPTGLSFGSSVFYKRKFSPAIRLILNEMINCRYMAALYVSSSWTLSIANLHHNKPQYCKLS